MFRDSKHSTFKNCRKFVVFDEKHKKTILIHLLKLTQKKLFKNIFISKIQQTSLIHAMHTRQSIEIDNHSDQ